jgi:hypothetical protein
MMMQLRWIVKVTPKTKKVLQGIVDDYAASAHPIDHVAARTIAEVFDLKYTEGVK